MRTTTRTSPRYHVRQNTGGTVTLTSGDELVLAALGEYTESSLSRTYWVNDPPSGRAQHVHEITDSRPGTIGHQICEKLQGGGATLTATRESLPRVIRRELRAAIRAELRARED